MKWVIRFATFTELSNMARMLKAGTVSVPTTPTSKGALHSRRKAYSSRLHQQERWVCTVGSLKKETVADLIILYWATGQKYTCYPQTV